MKRIHAIALMFVASFASCSTAPDSVSDFRIQAFDRETTKLSADTDRVITDQPITITLRCLPRVSGRGQMAIWGSPADTGSYIIVESPVRDTLPGILTPDTSSFSIIVVDFVANVPVNRTWQIRFPMRSAQGSYTFGGTVILDSVYIAERSGWYPVESTVARSYTPHEAGYDYINQATHLIFYP